MSNAEAKKQQDKPKIGIFCEESGAIRDLGVEKGLNIFSIDIQEGRGHYLKNHIVKDAKEALYETNWDLIIAHPPCDYLANSGVRWLSEDPERWKSCYRACQFFKLFINYAEKNKIPYAIENPIIHKYAKDWIGRSQDFSIHPHFFGDPFKKTTCFWTGRPLPELERTHWLNKEDIIAKCHLEPPSKYRKRNRSVTEPGVAKAIVEQWLIPFSNNM